MDPTLKHTYEQPCPKCGNRDAVYFQTQANRDKVMWQHHRPTLTPHRLACAFTLCAASRAAGRSGSIPSPARTRSTARSDAASLMCGDGNKNSHYADATKAMKWPSASGRLDAPHSCLNRADVCAATPNVSACAAADHASRTACGGCNVPDSLMDGVSVMLLVTTPAALNSMPQ